ncbi:MAG TPA: hypothetical protein PK771_00730 [Spirochaetota bacterium]|nr:hypothetical protein [Spirochaetota bacterium]
MSDEKQGQKQDKNKKINKMSVAELEKAIEKTKEHQGDLQSRYGLELIKRKEYLQLKGKK